MVELRLPPVPADLKHVLPFLQRAQEVRARDLVVCYWSLYYVARLGMQRGKTQENQQFLGAVLEHLEGMKRSFKSRRQITDEAAGSQHIRRFGFSVYEAAKNEDAQGQATRATAKKFLAASYFLEILRAFGPLDTEASSVEETIKYAKFKAGDIVRVLREATTPAPGIAAVPRYANEQSPSTLSPQQTGSLLSSRSAFHSPGESPTGAHRRAFPFPQHPPRAESGGSGSAPVSPRTAPGPSHSPFRQVERIVPPVVRSPQPASPRKLQSPIRSPLAVNGSLSRDATPIIRSQSLPLAPKPPSPPALRTSSPPRVKVTSPAKVLHEMPPHPVLHQPLPQWPPTNFVLTRPGEWPQQALVSPSMHSSMTVDSTDTFTSSQLRTVIKSGSMAAQAAPRADSPIKAESIASTSQQSDSQMTESETSDDESVAESTFIPVLTVVDELAGKADYEPAQGGSLVAVASPAVDDWSFEREMSEAIGRLTRPSATPTTGSSPLSWACNTPIPESPDAAFQSTLAQTPAQTSRPLAGTTTAGPAVVIPQSPAQPSPTTPNMRSQFTPSPTSPTSIMMSQSFKSAAELIDMQFSKVYGKFDGPDAVNDDDVVDVEDDDVESGSSGSFSSGSEEESEANEDKDERSQSGSQSGSSEGSDSEGGSSVSEMTIMSAQASSPTKGDEPQRVAATELKSLMKTPEGPNGVQVDAIAVRKTVRFAPSVVGGLSPEVPKQILPPPPLLNAQRSSPPLQIIPASAVSGATPLVRPKSLTIRSNSYDSYQSGPKSPDSPSYGPARPSGMAGYAQAPALVDGRPQEEFAIIPFHPSMSASHPPPAVHNNPAYTPARTPWNSSPPQNAQRRPQAIDRETASLAQKYSRFAISSLNYMDIETAKKELRAALSLLEGEMY